MTDVTPGDKTRQFKQALWAVGRKVLPDVANGDNALLVRYGRPSRAEVNNYNDIAALLRVGWTQDPATLGTNRAREINLTATWVISVFRPGIELDPDDVDDVSVDSTSENADLEQVATDQAWRYVNELTEYCRATDTTLGNVVRRCFATSCTELDVNDQALLSKGRAAELNLVFTAAVRIAG